MQRYSCDTCWPVQNLLCRLMFTICNKVLYIEYCVKTGRGIPQHTASDVYKWTSSNKSITVFIQFTLMCRALSWHWCGVIDRYLKFISVFIVDIIRLCNVSSCQRLIYLTRCPLKLLKVVTFFSVVYLFKADLLYTVHRCGDAIKICLKYLFLTVNDLIELVQTYE